MERSVEMQAANVDIAIEKALAELGTTRDRVEVEVLSKGGLFSRAKVKVTVKDTLKDKLLEFFNGTLERMGLVCRATAEEKDGTIYINIEGEDSSVAIGHRGETLDALQYLALTFLNEHKGEFKKLVVDAENYREKRKETLTALAQRLAQKAIRLRRKIALEPMNPFERRIIHSALADDPNVTTESEGEEPARYIVIIPVGVELKSSKPIKNGESDRPEHRRDDRRGRGRRDNRRREGKPRREDNYEEIEDGNVYLGYYTQQDDFVKPAPQAGPPKYKSFGGRKRF